MKKILSLCGVAALVLATVISAPAQTTIVTGTGTNGPVVTTNNPTPPANFSTALEGLAAAVTSSTNWAALGGYGRSTSGGKNLAFAGVAYNFSDFVGAYIGYEDLWDKDGSQQNNVKGGITLKVAMHPFAFLGSTALTNVVCEPFVGDLVATSGSQVANIITTGVNFNLHQWKNLELIAGLQYEKRNGDARWDGSYILVHFGLMRRF